jgi:hypothetical protein
MEPAVVSSAIGSNLCVCVLSLCHPCTFPPPLSVLHSGYITYVPPFIAPIFSLRLLLNFLRTGKVVLPESKWHLQEILLEAEFFGVDEVREGVQRAIGGLKFEDNFSSLITKETSWKACPIVTYCSVDNLSSSRKTANEGMPQFCSIIDMDGRSAMRMTSVMSDMTRRAMCTVEKFDSDAQRVEVTFRVLPLEDESLPYLVGRKNCETVFELFLWNPNSLEYIGIYLHSDGGDTRSLNIACYESGHKKEKRVEGSWQYNTEMMFTIQAAGEKTEVKVTTVGTPSTRGAADAADTISNTAAAKGKKKFHVPVSLSRIAPFHVVLGQRSGLPASVCYADCAVRRVAVLI